MHPLKAKLDFKTSPILSQGFSEITSKDFLHHNHLTHLIKMQILGWTPDSLNQNLWG